MSDFLSRLAERALGATPPLQPLLGSRFAVPAAEPAEGFMEETVEGESSASPAPVVRRSEVSLPPPPRPLSAAPADAREVDAAPSTLLMPAPPPIETSAAVPSPQDRSESPAPVAGDAPPSRPAPRIASLPPSPGAAANQGMAGEHRERQERGEDQALLIPIVTRTDPSVPAPSAVGSEDADARPSRVDGGRRVEAAPRGMTEVVVRMAEGERDPFGEEEDSGTLLMPVSRDRQTVVIGGDAVDGDRAEPRHPRAPERVPAMEKGAGERPVVQVTIGRIEVRAVHPPALPQPAREAGWTPPVLSLDDYLKRGSGR